MKIFLLILTFLVILFSNNTKLYADEDIQKYVLLKGKETNVRNGPGEEYNVLRVYQKTTMPLAVIHRIDNWYMISDYKNQIGWIKVNLVTSNLKNRKVILKKNDALCKLPVAQESNCIQIANIEKGVVAKVKSCNKTWCRLLLDKHLVSGWVKRDSIWGISPNEII